MEDKRVHTLRLLQVFPAGLGSGRVTPETIAVASILVLTITRRVGIQKDIGIATTEQAVPGNDTIFVETH